MSDKHFNNLTPGEAERLAWLSEELGEAIQAIGKIQRHGYESVNPFIENSLTNREHLAKELGQVRLVIDILISYNEISQEEVREAYLAKLKTAQPFLHHTTLSE